MTIVQTSDGYTYSIPETLPPKPAQSVETGQIVLNATDGDGTHLLLKGTLPSGDEYIRCEDAGGTEKFAVKHDGSLKISNLQTSTIANLNTDWGIVLDGIAEIEDLAAETAKIENAGEASSTDGSQHGNTLVKRATGTAFCEIDNLQSEVFRCVANNPEIALFGNGAIQFIPMDSNANIIQGCEYSFGKKLDNFGDPTQAGDGLFMKNDDNTIQLEVRKGAPTFRITGEKNNY